MTATRGTTTSDTSPTDAATAGGAATMSAVVQSRYGSAHALALAETPRPTPRAGEVLLEVHAAGVDRGVWHLMTGTPYLIRLMGFGLRRPKNPVPGMDVAGRVVAVGADVTRFDVGDEVFGIGVGTFAQYAVAREDKLAHKPAGLGWAEAAVVAISGLTARQAVHDIARVGPGQRVLVLGASGGVGSYAVQLAHAAGAVVTGVASGAKADLVRSLGADRAIDYGTTDVTTLDERFDAIIDVGGRLPVRRLRRILVPEGTLVIVGGENGGRVTGGIGRQLRAAVLSLFIRQRLTFFFSAESADAIERLREHILAGEIRPALETTYSLSQAATALVDLESGRVRGKAAIVVKDAA
jgi:NADPH:quinone reductase-like Zn-dependent oxidoreductase